MPAELLSRDAAAAAALDPLVRALRLVATDPAPWTLARIGSTLRSTLPAVRQIALSELDVPYGRYLVHHDPADRFNVQLDAFSRDYVGGVHEHGTWGIFYVLRGTLYSEDFAAGSLTALRQGAVSAGGAAGFVPPEDWHRVGTGDGPQVVSIHVYGAGFDLDEGSAWSPERGFFRYRRGQWADPAAVAGLFGRA
jgi:predicted metal-dependent enzyme (double-stranded beta helix superfamily)